MTVAGAVGVEPTSSGSKPDAVTVALRPNVGGCKFPNLFRLAEQKLSRRSLSHKKERKNNNNRHPLRRCLWCSEWDLNPHDTTAQGF